MDEREQALFFFRKVIYAIYYEIGALQPRIHPAIAAKADIRNGFFQGEKQPQSVELYERTEHEQTPAAILAPYIERTQLTLEDVHRAFVEGDWKNKFGGYNAGGPKWAHITEVAMALRSAIEQEDWELAAQQTHEIKRLKTNQGLLINVFDRTDRRRSS